MAKAASKAPAKGAGKSTKSVFFFGNKKAEGMSTAPTDKERRLILGGKGAGLADMTAAGLPVPPGFTISIPNCEDYYKAGRKLTDNLKKQVRENMAKVEKAMGKKFGDVKDPLLFSVRSGAARSMPGMMETILNLGLNDKSVEGLAKKTNNARFAYDAYRRFIQMYSTTAMGLSKEPMEEMLHAMKHKLGVKTDPEIPAEGLKELCGMFKQFYSENMKGQAFPQDPYEQLWGAIGGRVQQLGSRQGRHLPPRREDQRPERYRGQRPDHGLRQHGRQLGHGRLLHPRSQHRRERVLRRLPDQRPGRRRRGRYPHPDEAHRAPEAPAQGLQAAVPGSRAAREALQRTCRTWSSPSRKRSCSCSSAARASGPRPPSSRWPWTWSRRSS